MLTKKRKSSNNEDAQQGESDLPERIKNVLVECRMALPGAQALVGFQFVDVFFSSFEELSRSLQLVHLAICSLVATLLLIAPASFSPHRGSRKRDRAFPEGCEPIPACFPCLPCAWHDG
jgi:hypothetical protein